MKFLQFGVLSVLMVCWVGCESAEGERVQPVRQVGAKLGEGIRGEGQIVEVDRSDDPFVR